MGNAVNALTPMASNDDIDPAAGTFKPRQFQRFRPYRITSLRTGLITIPEITAAGA
jgi:hypothetical protein